MKQIGRFPAYFIAAADWQINEADFNGGSSRPAGQLGHTHGFTIRFYLDNSGVPGTRAFEQDVMTFTETQYCDTGVAGYRYTELDISRDDQRASCHAMVLRPGQLCFGGADALPPGPGAAPRRVLDRPAAFIRPQIGFTQESGGSSHLDATGLHNPKPRL